MCISEPKSDGPLTRRKGHEQPVPGELLFRVTTVHVTLLRPKRPADAPPMFILSLQMTPASARPLLTQLPEYRDPPQEIRSAD